MLKVEQSKKKKKKKVGAGNGKLAPPFPGDIAPYPAPLPFPSGINQDLVSFSLWWMWPHRAYRQCCHHGQRGKSPTHLLSGWFGKEPHTGAGPSTGKFA